MGEDTATRLSILTKLSNLSVKYSKRRRKAAGKDWLKVKKELEAVCGRLSDEDAAEERQMLLEREAAARRHGLADIPPSGEMTLVRKRRH